MRHESMAHDVVVAGAGPAGTSTARQQLCRQHGHEISVCVPEKGSEVGAHVLSGAVPGTRARDELIPVWRQRGAPMRTAVSEQSFLLLRGQGGDAAARHAGQHQSRPRRGTLAALLSCRCLRDAA